MAQQTKEPKRTVSSIVLPSLTVMTPSRPTFSMALAIS